MLTKYVKEEQELIYDCKWSMEKKKVIFFWTKGVIFDPSLPWNDEYNHGKLSAE